MHSSIYSGHVKHGRYAPIKNIFRYRIFMMYLDLAELDTVFRKRWFWSIGRFNLAYLRRKDHFGDPKKPLELAVRDLVHEETGERLQGPIRMLTHLRYFGHCFNPATFYYCFDAKGENVETIITEIHNTPWGEVHCYVLEQKKNEGTIDKKRFRFSKGFHVSPFIDMDVEYDWHFDTPGDTLHIHMKDLKDNTKFFEAELLLTKKTINGPNLAKVLVGYPLMTIKVIVMIYWQALRLWLKGATVYDHPVQQEGKGG